jgi:hypothetical protein
MEFKDKVKAVLAQLFISKEQLANELGCTPLTIHRLENEKTGSQVKWYYYDESGIFGFGRDGQDYIFQKNILGDIVNIFNLPTGAYIGGYVYDAWGRLFVRAYTLLRKPFYMQMVDLLNLLHMHS